MMKKTICITAGNVRIEAELNDSGAAELIYKSLPITSVVSTWGEEIYFNVPVKADMDNPVETVEIGDLAYWPQGPAFCVFFGETPISSGGKIIPAGAVEIIGRVKSGLDALPDVSPRAEITVAKKGE